MKGIAALELFGQKELETFHAATDLVALLPEKDMHEQILRCHEVARVVGKLLDLEIIDGRYEYGCGHSWCVIRRVKYRGFAILDPYAVGRVPLVQLISVIPTIPTRYFPEGKRDDIRTDVVKHFVKWFRSK